MGSVKQNWRCSSYTPSVPFIALHLVSTATQSHSYVRMLSCISGSILVNVALKWSFKDVYFPVITSIRDENAVIWEVMWELTAVSSHRSPVYLMEVSATKRFHIAFYSWNIHLFCLGRWFFNVKKHPSLCFRTEKTLLSCLQTASLLTSDDIVSKSLRALTCLELVILKYCDLCQQIADLAPTRSSVAHLQKQGLLTRLMFFRMIPAWQMTDADSLHHTLDILKCPFSINIA